MKIKNLTVCYEQLAILEDFSLELPDQGIICFFAPSGTGKTTARGRPFFCWIAACDTAPGEDEEAVDVCVRFCGKPGGFAGFPLVISSFIRYNERIPGEGRG